jgi:hypothetical protein
MMGDDEVVKTEMGKYTGYFGVAPEEPENPDTPEEPENPGEPDNPENPDEPEVPENPNQTTPARP